MRLMRSVLLSVLSGLLLSFAPLTANPSTRAQDTAANPYIYYYSDLDNAFIIERADGTETRLLAQGLMPDATNGVDGPGWSPSGKWFAWNARFYGAYNTQNLGAYAIRADGSRTMTFPYPDVNLYWSPSSDLLLMDSRQWVKSPTKDQPDRNIPSVTLRLIDPERDIIYWTKTIAFYGYFNEPYSIRWLDAAHFLLFNTTPSPNSLEAKLTSYIGSTDGLGEPQEMVVYSDAYMRGNDSAVLFFRNADSVLSAKNMLTGQHYTFADLSFARDKEFPLFTVLWNPAHTQAFLIGDRASYFLSLADNRAQALTLSNGRALVSDDFYLGLIGGLYEMIWSPSGKYALFAVDDTLYRFDPLSGALVALPLQLFANHGDGTSGYVNWEWLSDTRVEIYDHDVGKTNIRRFYDLDLTTFTFTMRSIPAQYTYSFTRRSPDGRRLAWMDDGPTLYDLTTAIYTYARPHSRGWNSIYGTDVRWHASSQWLLTFDNGGDFPCCFMTSIMRPDGTQRRDLTVIYGSLDLLGWLPERVTDLASPADKPVHPKPQKILSGWTGWSADGLFSWSSDSKQLAAVSVYDKRGSFVWNIDTGQYTIDATNHIFDTELQQTGGGTSIPVSATPQPYTDDNNATPVGENFTLIRDAAAPRLVDRATGRTLVAFSDRNAAPLSPYNVSLSPDKSLLAVAFGRFTPVWIYETATWRKIATLAHNAYQVQFSPDGKWLAADVSWDIALYSTNSLRATPHP